ncbi:MAG: hypothetical protein ACTS8S_02425 [Giesbergeria sp.]
MEQVVRRATELEERSDYRRQCSLAGPDLTFKVTDHNTSPPSVLAGDRHDLCVAQRDSAQAMNAMEATASISLGKLAISLSSDSTKATVKYETMTKVTHKGEVLMHFKCVREEVLGVYDGEILYAQADAVCKP